MTIHPLLPKSMGQFGALSVKSLYHETCFDGAIITRFTGLFPPSSEILSA